LVSLGDLTDYHPDSAAVIDLLMTIPHLVAVRGNHDLWAYEYLQLGESDPIWLHNGGEATVESFASQSSLQQARYLRFFSQQKRYWIDEGHRLFVHAGFVPNEPIETQSDDILFWERKFWTMAAQHGNEIGPWPSHPFHEVFLGHSPTHKLWPDAKPVNFGNVWNVDQGVKREGRLTLLDVDSKEYWQSDFAPDLYPLSF
jgi:serine/threonine protein phosphatase 1